MGTVYAAIQPLIEKRVAIKVLSQQFSASPYAVRRFIDEARAVNRIGHENIVDIFSFGQLADGRHYFVMDHLQGATLGDRLKTSDLSPEDLPPLFAQICDALDAAHAHKIVHRDLKPENVWIAGARPARLSVRLLDFGIAKLLESGEGTITDAGAVVGTPQYMSPEQCNGRGVDQRTDIYAMGVMLYRIYTGCMPIRGATYAEIIGKQMSEMPARPSTIARVPAALDRLIMSCLEKDSSLRPQSAHDLGAALAAALSGPGGAVPVARPIEDLRTAAPAPPPAAGRRRWALVAAGVLGASAVAALALRATWLSSTAPPAASGPATASAPAPPATSTTPTPINRALPGMPAAPHTNAVPAAGATGVSEDRTGGVPEPTATAKRTPPKIGHRRSHVTGASAVPAPNAAATAPVPVEPQAPPKKDYGF